MKLRIFLLASSLICSLFFLYLAFYGLDNRFFKAFEQSFAMDHNTPMDWSSGFITLGLILGLGNLLLYFLAKNWRLGIYLGTFAIIMVLSILMGTFIISH